MTFGSKIHVVERLHNLRGKQLNRRYIMQQVKQPQYKTSISQEEINALNDVVDYILGNELISYEETDPSEQSEHIYAKAITLRRWIDKGGNND
jgi:hypothetical protein